mmetsp:Transcript_15643/g.25827  ORF Transcript_15643/g.25827 Transcript_15643/m.25827 type:complete len:81 (-) Transcript_15643:555-797(-)
MASPLNIYQFNSSAIDKKLKNDKIDTGFSISLMLVQLGSADGGIQVRFRRKNNIMLTAIRSGYSSKNTFISILMKLNCIN